ncbi:hypothetical protein EON63_19460, partial [archaeon]
MHSLVASALSSFGGGYIAFMLIGRPAAPLNNDIIIFSTILAWFLIFNLKLSWFFTHTYVRTIWSFALGLFRTHAAVNIVTMSNTILAPTAYYPIPLFGPIIAGTVLGEYGYVYGVCILCACVCYSRMHMCMVCVSYTYGMCMSVYGISFICAWYVWYWYDDSLYYVTPAHTRLQAPWACSCPSPKGSPPYKSALPGRCKRHTIHPTSTIPWCRMGGRDLRAKGDGSVGLRALPAL